MEKTKKKTEVKGITLIALVITIIVLLILAGISISMLSGDNSILQKATDAKTITERQSIVEQAKTDVLGHQVENKGIDLQKSQLQSVLETYFKDVPDLTEMSDVEILEKQLETLPKYGTHNITVKEIFNGTLSGGNSVKTATADEINAKIGTVVNGYSAKDLQWQVYYADENETFLISKTVAYVKQISHFNEKNDYHYVGSVDVRNSEYGSKWNKKWLEKCSTDVSNNGESIRDNAKATAQLCDPDYWSEYKVEPATYAVGAPTVELLIASYNKSQGTNIVISDSDVTSEGFVYNKPSELYDSEPLQQNVNNGVYNSGDTYWMASPSTTDNSKYIKIKGVDNTGKCARSNRLLYNTIWYFILC